MSRIEIRETGEIRWIGGGVSRFDPPEWAVIEDGRPIDSYATREKALGAAFTAYAWPGGYVLEYLSDGCILCAECARAAWEEDNETEIDSYAVEEADYDIRCDGCDALIFAQNLCPDHGATWVDERDGVPAHCGVCRPELNAPCLDFDECGRPAFGDDIYCRECRERKTRAEDEWLRTRREMEEAREENVRRSRAAEAAGLGMFLGADGRTYYRVAGFWATAV